MVIPDIPHNHNYVLKDLCQYCFETIYSVTVRSEHLDFVLFQAFATFVKVEESRALPAAPHPVSDNLSCESLFGTNHIEYTKVCRGILLVPFLQLQQPCLWLHLHLHQGLLPAHPLHPIVPVLCHLKVKFDQHIMVCPSNPCSVFC